jgi:hypothetical protein
MKTNTNRSMLFTLAVAIAALTGCDGGSYDATTGRLSATEQRDARSAGNAQRSSDDGLSNAAGAQGQPSAAYGQQGPAQRAPEAREFAEARRAATESGTFDPFSRTPPTPTAQPGAQPGAEPTRPQIAAVSPSSGPIDGQNEVLITGSGFGGVQVMWGSQIARITSQSSNAVTVIVPAAERASAVTVVVTNRDGTYAVMGNGYQYR